ncbi:hypothetical protein [Halospeciosus flavus]|uniref:Uncharacterized protein n=1 Tax=Halospeciosus flavus TaxID=3032283 RepID=A0ABD5Z6B8_9EURY|nr:hypothetical protein [Halospeciosus flavus]
MKDPETSVLFAGVDGRVDAELPAWYRATKTADTVESEADVVTFAEAVRTLPRAAPTTVAYHDPFDDVWVETERFNALVEPCRLAEGNAAEQDPLFAIPTDSYTVINPVDVYGPLGDLLTDTTLDDTALGEAVFGEIRQYRGGGEVHMDVMFDGLSVELPGRDEPIALGVTSGYDFFGGHAVYVEGFAQDTACSNSMRALTDRVTVKHVGDVADFEAWWEQLLAQLELVTNDLYDFIVDAQDIALDLTDVPFDLAEFYTLLEFPDYLAERAAGDARAEAADPFHVDMWTLHSGATYALTHFFSGKEGAALDAYTRTANDILFNPEATLDRVERTYAEQARAAADEEGSEAAGPQALAQVERASADVRAKAETFEARETLLRERFQDAAE